MQRNKQNRTGIKCNRNETLKLTYKKRKKNWKQYLWASKTATSSMMTWKKSLWAFENSNQIYHDMRHSQYCMSQ